MQSLLKLNNILFIGVILSGVLVLGQLGRPPYNLRIVFEGAIAFHSDNWTDLQGPLWVLMPDLSHQSYGEHQPRLSIPQSAVNTMASDQPDGHTLDFAYYQLNAEHMSFPQTTANHERPLYQHPDEVPCSQSNHHCGTIGSQTYRAQFRVRRDYSDWLVGIQRLAPLYNGVPRQLKSNLFSNSFPTELAARMKFDKGWFKTYLLEGEHHPDQLDHREVRVFTMEYNNGSRDRPVANSILGEFTVDNPLKITLTDYNNNTRQIALHPIPDGEILQIFLTNLPKKPGTTSVGHKANHFRGFYDKLLEMPPQSNEEWPLPTVKRIGRGGDEACPPGCTIC